MVCLCVRASEPKCGVIQIVECCESIENRSKRTFGFTFVGSVFVSRCDTVIEIGFWPCICGKMNSHKSHFGFYSGIQVFNEKAQSLVLNIHNGSEKNAKSGFREHNSYWLSNEDGVRCDYSLYDPFGIHPKWQSIKSE